MKIVNIFNKKTAVLDERLYSSLLSNTAVMFEYLPVKLYFTKNAIFPRKLLKDDFKVVRNIDSCTHIIYNNFSTKSRFKLDDDDEITIENKYPTYIELNKVDIESYNVLSSPHNREIMNSNVLFNYIFKDEPYDLELIKNNLLICPNDSIVWNNDLIAHYKQNMSIYNNIWNTLTVHNKTILNKYKASCLEQNI